ncbi:MAG: B12-binding domain-containing radical SAM protein [Gemmatimonadetes bacterium]|nr:B12-binding domain-containing radical SAM protein [Gemmatimonadota bacterium]
MRVHLVNPSELSFGVGVITPRWLYVLAGATPTEYGDPNLIDETLEPVDLNDFQAGDVVGIGIHTSNAMRGYEVGKAARERGAFVVFGGIHARLYPEEALERGGAHSVVRGDGDVVWGQAISDCLEGTQKETYEAGMIEADQFAKGRWDLIPEGSYMWASVQTVRGCPKHCSFCSVWRTDGQRPRQRQSDHVMEEIVDLRRRGFRFIALADDNFYPVPLRDLELAERRTDKSRYNELRMLREERFDLMRRMALLPKDMIFFTQITMEAAEDPEFLDAMREARIRGALVGIESVTPEGLKTVYKGFNLVGQELIERLQTFREHGVYILGSFIFGLSSDRAETFDATLDLADKADLAFAQFVSLSVFPGTIDFKNWEEDCPDANIEIDGVPLKRYWLIPSMKRPKLYTPHPTMTVEEIRQGSQGVWDSFYSLRLVWKRSRICPTVRSRLAFLFLSKLYRQMYANTGIATDSARVTRSTQWARLLAKPCRRLFQSGPMPDLQVPEPPDLPVPELPLPALQERLEA